MPHTFANGDRRLDLDWIRVCAFGLLIIYHVGMLYVPWDFHVKSIHQSNTLPGIMALVNPWRMSILFLVSGAATRFMLDKTSPGALAGRRSWRLLVPLAFGVAVIVPPQSYAEVVEKLGFSGSYPDFWFGHYLAFDQNFCRLRDGRQYCIVLPTWNHLWFVVYLWVYTVILAGAAALTPGTLAALERFVERLPAPALLVGPALLLAALHAFVYPRFPPTQALFDDVYGHAIYVPIFLFGFLIARSGRFAEAVEKLRWPALAIAVTAYVAMILLGSAPWDEMPVSRARPLAFGLDQWCAILAILGFARRFLKDRDGPLLRYAAGAVFCWYIVHQTIIVMAAHWLKPLALPAATEAMIIIAATIAGCWASYEIARRIPFLRPLLGIAPSAEPAELTLRPSPR
ncbi:MAG: acyltransferase [Phreatobacter sp.]|uniref:acyltransferase family protein n=1 Tax=Phreatobacter sp. TaxID=1966341 RepID=UPI001A4F0FFB|nr:acyltransferase [Phreatobacter sp.]MBL8570325.1 acyltransferase [Phreatobacter sp.]